MKQSYSNWELIIFDNNSTDKTFSIIKKFKKNNKIRYFKSKIFLNLYHARNLAVKKSKGEFIAFLDADDWWTKDKLEICYENINEKLDFIYHKMEVIDGNQKFYYIKKLSRFFLDNF